MSAAPSVGLLAPTFTATFLKHASSECFGTSVNDEAFVWTTYSAVHARALAIGAALHELVGDGAMVAYCAPNSMALLHVDLGAMWAGLTSAPFSAGCRDRDVIFHILNTTQAKLVVCSHEALPTIFAVASICPALEHIVVIDAEDGRALPALDGVGASAAAELHGRDAHAATVEVTLLSFITLRGAALLDGEGDAAEAAAATTAASRSAALAARVRPRAATDLFSLIFTSGSTGFPKAVIWSDKRWKNDMISYPNTIGVSHMPLSHITDRHGVYTSLFSGGRVGVYEATTHDGPSDLFSGWLRKLEPTILKGSPRHFTTLMDLWRDSGASLEEWRAMNMLGPRIVVLASGGAHLAAETKRFLQRGFGTTDGRDVCVVDAFGSTESGNITGPSSMLSHSNAFSLLSRSRSLLTVPAAIALTPWPCHPPPLSLSLALSLSLQSMEF